MSNLVATKIEMNSSVNGNIQNINQQQVVNSNTFIREEVKIIGGVENLSLRELASIVLNKLENHNVDVLESFEKILIEQSLQKHVQQNIAAKALGISTRAICYKVDKYNLSRFMISKKRQYKLLTEKNENEDVIDAEIIE